MKLMKKIGFVGLGCDKNRVDLERMIGSISNNNFIISNNPDDCDVIIINTCAFIKSARDESEDAINEYSALKKQGKIEKLIITGCYNELGKQNLQELFPEVDAFVSIKDNFQIASVIANLYNEKLVCNKDDKSRLLTTPQFAYLKISDGCDNFCSYCKIPYIRGRYKSEPLADLVEEANNLASSGVTELIIVAQDVTRYGSDFKDGTTLITLLKELSKIEKIKWIRLLYCYPESMTDELIDEIANNTKICKYIDIPLQHVSDNILKAMNRRNSYDKIIALIKKLRNKIPNIAIRTTFILGFPNETEEDFSILKDFLKKEKLNNVGFFAYSREEGTRAYNFDNQISEEVKEERVHELGEVQYKVAINNNKKLIGKEMEVVVDEISDGVAICRSEYLAPFIDPIIIVEANNKMKVGNYYKIKVVNYIDYDLEGELI